MEVNLDDSVFVRACRLHFTIVMLRGLDDEARMRAVHDALESVRDEIQRILGELGDERSRYRLMRASRKRAVPRTPRTTCNDASGTPGESARHLCRARCR